MLSREADFEILNARGEGRKANYETKIDVEWIVWLFV